MSAFDWSPAPGASKAVAPRVRAANFGDGYQQHVADGINAAPSTWNLTFPGLSAAVANAIEAYLITAVGSSFDWTDPAGVAGKWMCASWQREVLGMGKATITATFTQVFGE